MKYLFLALLFVGCASNHSNYNFGPIPEFFDSEQGQ